MTLSESNKLVGRSIVAISVKRQPGEQVPPGMPKIVGTGFVVDEGLIATNDHVVQVAEQLAQLPGAVKGEWPLEVMLFHLVPEFGMVQLGMEVVGAFTVGVFNPGKVYYGPKIPDLGFLHVFMRDLPCLKVATECDFVEPGLRIATAGFPMGTDALMAPGYVHQLTPTLQEGIVSAVLPFACKSPHAYMLNFMSLGGASGSPVFMPESGEVIGVLYAGLNEVYSTKIQGQQTPYSVPTNLSYCVPAHYLNSALASIRREPRFVLSPEAPTFAEALSDLPAGVHSKGPDHK